MGDTSETNTKVLSRELALGVIALKTPIQKNHYLRDKGPFPRYSHILAFGKGSVRRDYYLCSSHSIDL